MDEYLGISNTSFNYIWKKRFKLLWSLKNLQYYYIIRELSEYLENNWFTYDPSQMI